VSGPSDELRMPTFPAVVTALALLLAPAPVEQAPLPYRSVRPVSAGSPSVDSQP